MGKNTQLKKRIEGLERSKEEHRRKIESYAGSDGFLIEYWEKEIAQRDRELRELRRKLR